MQVLGSYNLRYSKHPKDIQSCWYIYVLYVCSSVCTHFVCSYRNIFVECKILVPLCSSGVYGPWHRRFVFATGERAKAHPLTKINNRAFDVHSQSSFHLFSCGKANAGVLCFYIILISSIRPFLIQDRIPPVENGHFRLDVFSTGFFWSFSLSSSIFLFFVFALVGRDNDVSAET